MSDQVPVVVVPATEPEWDGTYPHADKPFKNPKFSKGSNRVVEPKAKKPHDLKNLPQVEPGHFDDWYMHDYEDKDLQRRALHMRAMNDRFVEVALASTKAAKWNM